MNFLTVNDTQIEIDGDGFMVDPGQWDEDVMHALAVNDGLELNEEHVNYIKDAVAMYEADGVCPSIRVFAKKHGMDRKAKPLYELFTSGVMKRIAKYSGKIPRPTGCV